ncbi:MAG: RpiB/LacA/LacB family sugar-phosphate isomerase [bacterium]|nr:RpiB/LacA/LacB family sugar-phosphate isomerase [bacterium]
MIYIGADYAGYKLKEDIKKFLDTKKIGYLDIGTDSTKSKNDFTDFIPPVVKGVKKSNKNFGILICGTGMGMVIGANRFRKIRAVQAYNTKQAKFSRTHDNANILCLAAWETDFKTAKRIITTWLNTPFKPFARRIRRFKKVDQWPI